MLFALHGPVWRENLDYFIGKYDLWSRYEPEVPGVVIMYASMYGNTENAANALAMMLAEDGIRNLAVYDVSTTHVSELISEAFKYSHIVLAAPTYNGGIYPVMANLLHDMKALNLSNRRFALMENGTWAPMAAKHMRAAMEGMKNMTILDTQVTIRSAMSEKNRMEIEQMAKEIHA